MVLRTPASKHFITIRKTNMTHHGCSRVTSRALLPRADKQAVLIGLHAAEELGLQGEPSVNKTQNIVTERFDRTLLLLLLQHHKSGEKRITTPSVKGVHVTVCAEVKTRLTTGTKTNKIIDGDRTKSQNHHIKIKDNSGQTKKMDAANFFARRK